MKIEAFRQYNLNTHEKYPKSATDIIAYVYGNGNERN